MKRKKFLSCLLAMAVAAGTFVPMTANAQTVNGEPVATILPSEDSQVEGTFPSKETQTANYKGNNEISTISIGELDAPQEGKLLDFSAVVNTDNGAAWKIPVIWSDEDGNLTTVKSSKVNSYPVFAFYMPKGYTIKDAQTITERIELPQAAKDIYAGRKVVKIVDPKTGWVFITCLDGPGKNLNVEAAAADFADIVKQFGEAEKANAEQAQGGGEQEGTSTQGIASISRAQQLVNMYCDENVKSQFSVEQLASLIELVRNTIEPKAVNLLIDGFPCFNEALKNGELSSNIGFYVFYDKALQPIDNKFNVEYQDSSNSAAYVHGYFPEFGRPYYVLAVNANTLFPLNEETNEREFTEQSQVDLENTITHELMHVFMNDYTAAGMDGGYPTEAGFERYGSLKFPKWFEEGMATAVENSYQYYYEFFTKGYGYTKENGYNTDDLMASYTANEKYQLLYGEDKIKDIGTSSYASGYLACMYLGYLASNDADYRAKYNIQGTAMEDIDDHSYVVNNDVICQGLSAILSEIHGRQDANGEWSSSSLDEVINELLGSQGISDSSQFANRFIQDLPDSAEFCADLLHYYYGSDDEAVHPAGSVLLPANSTQESVLDNVPAGAPKAYEIVDYEDYKMDPEDFAPQYLPANAENRYLDGGRAGVDPTTKYVEEDDEGDNQAAANAAKTDSTITEGEE